MTGFKNAPPRAHHYEFAHRALPAVLLDPTIDLERFTRKVKRLKRALTATWQAVGAGQPADDRVPITGLEVEAREIRGASALLIALPPAERPTEAYFVLVAPLMPPADRRYLTLEAGWDVVHQQPCTALGEWKADTHYNLGDGPSPEAGLFVDAVAAITSAYERSG